jgi:hypothetical protein
LVLIFKNKMLFLILFFYKLIKPANVVLINDVVITIILFLISTILRFHSIMLMIFSRKKKNIAQNIHRKPRSSLSCSSGGFIIGQAYLLVAWIYLDRPKLSSGLQWEVSSMLQACHQSEKCTLLSHNEYIWRKKIFKLNQQK